MKNRLIKKIYFIFDISDCIPTEVNFQYLFRFQKFYFISFLIENFDKEFSVKIYQIFPHLFYNLTKFGHLVWCNV